MLVEIKLLLLFSIFSGTVYPEITRLSQCNKFSAIFKVKKLRLKYQDSVSYLEKIKNVEHKERCSALCIENPKCKSAIYQDYAGTKKCFLYDRVLNESELRKSSNVYYMTTDEKDDDFKVCETIFIL